jgi:uncharacterized delta-60 repeat protein
MLRILLLYFAFCLSTFAFSQEYGWVDLSENIPNKNATVLTDVFFVTENEGWITTSSQNEIYHTKDGGLSFETQSVLQPAHAIHMLDDNRGFAGGQSGTVFYTNNGGTNWNLINSFLPSTIRGLTFPAESDTGFVCGDNGWVAKIDSTHIFDMEKLANGSFYDISFPTKNEGWLCGGAVIRHYKDGIWLGDQNYTSNGYYSTICFVDSIHGWAAGDGGDIIYTNDGRNWAKQQSPLDWTLNDIFFLNNSTGWAMGSGGNILNTNNAGTLWESNLSVLNINDSPQSVFFLSENSGFMVGSNSLFYKYTETNGTIITDPYDEVSVSWINRHNSIGGVDDLLYAMTIDDNNDIYVTGKGAIGGDPRTYCTLKYTSDGNNDWTKYYNNGAWDIAEAIAVDADKNVYVTGYSQGYGSNNNTGSDFCTIKYYDDDGIQDWVNRFSSVNSSTGIFTGDDAKAIVVDNNGDIIVTGTVQQYSEEIGTIKYDSTGQTVWQQIFINPEGYYKSGPVAMTADVENNIFITGYIHDESTHQPHILTIKYNMDGTEAWKKIYTGPTNYRDEANAITIDSEGNVIITGYSENYMCTIKYQTDGTQEWISTYTKPATTTANAVAYDVTTDEDGNIYVTGYCEVANAPADKDFCTIKYNSSGNREWVKTYNGTGNRYDEAKSVAADDNGNVYVTGSSFGNTSGEDFVTIKYDAFGEVIWLMRYNGPGNSVDVPVKIALDKVGDVIVAGTSVGDTTNEDYCVIKYANVTTGFNAPISNTINFKLFPNPTAGKFRVQSSAFKVEDATIELYDLAGKKLLEKPFPAGTENVEIDVSHLIIGCYFCKIQFKHECVTKKIIVNK